MFKKVTFLFSFVLVLGLVDTSVVIAVDLDTDPSLVGWWKFDEGSGNTAMDSSGNGFDIPLPDTATWEKGLFGGAVHFHGVGEGNVGGFRYSDNAITVCAWVWHDAFRGSELYVVVTPQVAAIDRLEDGRLHFRINTDGTIQHLRVFSDVLKEGQWHHVAGTWDGLTQRLYLDGIEIASQTPGGVLNSTTMVRLSYSGSPLNGMLDEVRVYNRALSSREIMFLFDPGAVAKSSKPIPTHGATDVPAEDVVLRWIPGDYADKHDVYFGTSFDDVSAATNLDLMAPDQVYRARQDTDSYAVGGRLDFGQTYYWRIDEVNAPPDSTIFKGDVWKFTVEPFAYPIENMTATASSSNSAGEGPENTVNGSGLDANNLHSAVNTDMWLSNITGPQPTWIQYEFDKAYKLHQVVVWNHNATTEPVIGFGLKEATMEYSTDGINWSALGTTHEFARGTGAVGYAANTTIDLGGAVAKYVKITANSNWGGLVNQYGLSEVRFLFVPIFATEPSPDSGATDVSVDATLSWKAGREAATHNVYLSTNEQAVIDGTAPVVTVTSASYVSSLDLASTYYWRIDEVNDAEVPSSWQGDIWSLSTQEYLVVDDFEAYNDTPAGEEGSNLVYETWVDGFGTTTNGSTIGYTEAFQPSMETSTVYDGKLSVPMFYNNTTASISEVTANVAGLQTGKDWSRYGIRALTLRFYGDPNNIPQQMYAKINSVKVTYDGSTDNLKRAAWQMWYIDLASLGTNLSNVNTLTIGLERIGGVGGQGMILLDGLRLYSHERQWVTPVAPDTVNLVAHWKLDESSGTVASDSSGNNHHGEVFGNPAWVSGIMGGALQFDGVDDRVEMATTSGAQGFPAVAGEVTWSLWLKTAPSTVGRPVMAQGPAGAAHVQGNRSITVEPSGVIMLRAHTVAALANFNSNMRVDDNEWHHVAVAIAFETNGTNDALKVYIDGELGLGFETDSVDINQYGGAAGEFIVTLGARGTFYDGLLDDVAVFNRALSQEEMAGLAGRSEPFYRPF